MSVGPDFGSSMIPSFGGGGGPSMGDVDLDNPRANDSMGLNEGIAAGDVPTAADPATDLDDVGAASPGTTAGDVVAMQVDAQDNSFTTAQNGETAISGPVSPHRDVRGDLTEDADRIPADADSFEAINQALESEGIVARGGSEAEDTVIESAAGGADGTTMSGGGGSSGGASSSGGAPSSSTVVREVVREQSGGQALGGMGQFIPFPVGGGMDGSGESGGGGLPSLGSLGVVGGAAVGAGILAVVAWASGAF